jgi:peptidoglycan/xylan/chitin deacetylase (PgdA/CDA1 family)
MKTVMMKRGLAVGFGALAVSAVGLAMLPGADAQQAKPQAQRACDPARTLGVSRTIEIDTSEGPRFGSQQYQENDFLQDGEIVLTFDDGPLRPFTQPVVDALEAQCTKATFFMVGTQALADPDLVKRIQRLGHTIGTHTWSHANLRKLTPLKARNEIEMGFSGVRAAAGQPIAPFFRFPFLADTKSMIGYAGTRGFGVFSIEVDAYDYKTKDPNEVHQAVLNQLAYKKKGILLFHDIQPATAQALPGLLAALKKRGFKVVHIRAKSNVNTMPEFDRLAQVEAQRKRVAQANNPLATRAVTWPNSGAAITAGGPPLPPGLDTKGQQVPPRTAAAPQPAVPTPAQAAPPLTGAQGVAVPNPQRLPRRPLEADWKTQIFSN